MKKTLKFYVRFFFPAWEFCPSFLFLWIHEFTILIAINEFPGEHLACGNAIPIMAVYFYATVLLGTIREFFKQLFQWTHLWDCVYMNQNVFIWSIPTKANNGNIRSMREICLKVTANTLQWCPFRTGWKD